MRCNVCGAISTELHRSYVSAMHATFIHRKCIQGHAFQTVEVYPNQLADGREMTSAIRRIDKRISLHNRDASIAQDPRPNKEVADAYGLTIARVRQIRAAILSERKTK